jgi:rhodanese-related sulfurtransferase
MIGTEETFEELEAESLIVDARRTKVYEEGHIPGARSMSPWEADLPEKIAKLVEEGHNLEAPVVIYCNDSKECEDSKMVARQLEAAGFLDLKIYQGGFPTWKKEKPDLVVKGSEPGALTP